MCRYPAANQNPLILIRNKIVGYELERNKKKNTDLLKVMENRSVSRPENGISYKRMLTSDATVGLFPQINLKNTAKTREITFYPILNTTGKASAYEVKFCRWTQNKGWFPLGVNCRP